MKEKLRVVKEHKDSFNEHLISFTQSLLFLCNYASLGNAELVHKEEALYLSFFTQKLKMSKFAISCYERAKKLTFRALARKTFSAKLVSLK